MNCRQFQKRMAELLDARPEGKGDAELLRHADECAVCRQDLAEAREILKGLAVSRSIEASSQFKERVMERIAGMDKEKGGGAKAPERKAWRLSPMRMVAAAVVLVAALAGYNWFAGRTGKPQISAFTVLAQAAEAMKSFATVHIRCGMRAPAQDNFTFIDLKHDMIPIDIWVDQGPPLRWRVDKGGRVVTCDGKSTLMLVYPGDKRDRPPIAYTYTRPAPGLVGELAPLLDLEGLLNRQIEFARSENSSVFVAHEKAEDGHPVIVLTVEAKAQGDYSQSDYLRNTSILTSDNTRLYQFNQETGLLEKMEVYVHRNGAALLVMQITSIDTNATPQADTFSTAAPADAITETQKELSEAGIEASGPKEVAEKFFQSMIANDWDMLERIYPSLGKSMAAKPAEAQWAKGLEVVHIGKPFKSGVYPGWFVPYEIRDKSGESKKFNLAVRNDYRNHLWQVDGGF